MEIRRRSIAGCRCFRVWLGSRGSRSATVWTQRLKAQPLRATEETGPGGMSPKRRERGTRHAREGLGSSFATAKPGPGQLFDRKVPKDSISKRRCRHSSNGHAFKLRGTSLGGDKRLGGAERCGKALGARTRWLDISGWPILQIRTAS